MQLQPEIPVEPPGSVLLHHEEPGTHPIGAHPAEGLGGAARVALLAISLQPVGHRRKGASSAPPGYMRGMPARAIATGTISFGLVSIPVRLFPATQSTSAISFNMLHAKDGSRLKQQYVCAKDGQVVPREETVKGYEYAKDRYVTFSAEELKALDEIATQSIDISEFVPASQVRVVRVG